MAALTATAVTKRLPVGDRWQITARATSGAAAADEWIDFKQFGLVQIDAVVGAGVIGAATSGGNFTKNAQGTGQSEGSTLGALGVEFAGTVTFEVTVIGR